MPDYNNGKIYKIISNKTNDIYIGSTTGALSRVLVNHRHGYKLYKQNKGIYWDSIAILKHDTDQYYYSKIILIETFPCKSRDELLAREQYWIEQLPCINRWSAKETKPIKNKKIAIRKSQKIICIYCGTYGARGAYTGHIKSQTHIDNVAYCNSL